MTGEELRELRASLGMTQEQFSQAVSVSRPTIANYETGNYPMPIQIDKLIRLVFDLPEKREYVKDDRHPDLF